MTKPLKIGTRGSELALWQANYLQSELKKHGIEAELVIIKTRGDKDLRPLKQIAGDGFFVKDLENALLKNEIDLAIHSAKDLASMRHHDLPWKALGPRASTRDVLIFKKSSSSSPYSFQAKKIGTSSPRRRAQLAIEASSCEAIEIRGNVPTRISKIETENLDGVILAGAGLNRLEILNGLQDNLSYQELTWTSAPCQGILAVQAKQNILDELSAVLDEELTRIALLEKSILAFLGGGCHMAVGAEISKLSEKSYKLDFFLSEDDNYSFSKTYTSLSDISEDMFFDISSCINGLTAKYTGSKEFVLTNTLATQKNLVAEISRHGLKAISLPLSQISSSLRDNDFSSFLDSLSNKSNVVFTSQYAVRIFFMEFFNQANEIEELAGVNFFCVGNSTQKKLEEFGIKPQPISWDSNSASLVEYLSSHLGKSQKLSFVGTKSAKFIEHAQQVGFKIDFLAVYTNDYPESLELSDKTEFQDKTICFSSPSAVERFISRYGKKSFDKADVLAIGPSTSKALNGHNIKHDFDPNTASWPKIIEHYSQQGDVNAGTN